MRASFGATDRVIRSEDARAEQRADVRLSVHPLQLLAQRRLDVGVGYLAHIGAHEALFVDIGTPLLQRRLNDDLTWRLTASVFGRHAWESGRAGWGTGVQVTSELARFIATDGCSDGFVAGARGDLGVGVFSEGAVTRLDGIAISTVSFGIAGRIPAIGFFGIEHAKCEGGKAR